MIEVMIWLLVAAYLASLARLIYRRPSVMAMTLPGVILLSIIFLVLFG